AGAPARAGCGATLAAGAAHAAAGAGRLPRLLLLLPGADPADGVGLPRPPPGTRLGPSRQPRLGQRLPPLELGADVPHRLGGGRAHLRRALRRLLPAAPGPAVAGRRRRPRRAAHRIPPRARRKRLEGAVPHAAGQRHDQPRRAFDPGVGAAGSAAAGTEAGPRTRAGTVAGPAVRAAPALVVGAGR